jgi:hypothetical protein
MGAQGSSFREGMAQMGASEVPGEDGAAGEAGAAVVGGAIEGESEKEGSGRSGLCTSMRFVSFGLDSMSDSD